MLPLVRRASRDRILVVLTPPVDVSFPRGWQVCLSQSQSLNELKDEISRSDLGPIDRNYQRLFHLGRELKSGGRSLSRLGIGRFHNFVVHLHSTQPEALELSSDEEKVDDDDDRHNDEKVPERSSETPKRGNATIIDLLDESDDEVVAVSRPAQKRLRR